MKINLSKLNIQKIEPWVFGLMVLVNLIPIWVNTYFLTCDGPCHIYNAKVLLDYWTDVNQEFYKPYYYLNTNFEPNFLTSYLLAFFLSFLPDYLAEKSLLTVYILTFAISLRWLIAKINPANKAFALAGMPFIYQKSVQIGFFNYSLSIALMFLILAYWLHNRSKFTPLKQLVFCILSVLIFFTHAGGLTITIMLLGFLWIMDVIVKLISERNNVKENIKIWKNEAVNMILCFLPAVLLQLAFLFRRPLSPSPGKDTFEQLTENILNLTALVNLSNKEEIFATSLVYLFIALLIAGIITKIYSRKFSSFDAFFLLAIISVFVYYNLPGNLSGGSILSIRFQCVPFYLLVLWFGSLPWHNAIRWITLLAACIIGIGLIAMRQPIHKIASEAVVEYTSVRNHIEDQSTVLPLSFSHNGKTLDGEWISDKLWLFLHGSEYIGTDKSLVIFTNYEANAGYFPFVWHWDRNPFRQMAIDGRGIEDQPPSADILGYAEKSFTGKIDYVITWCLDDSVRDADATKHILNQLNEAYEHVFTSENGMAVLYKRKDIPEEEVEELR